MLYLCRIKLPLFIFLAVSSCPPSIADAKSEHKLEASRATFDEAAFAANNLIMANGNLLISCGTDRGSALEPMRKLRGKALKEFSDHLGSRETKKPKKVGEGDAWHNFDQILQSIKAATEQSFQFTKDDSQRDLSQRVAQQQNEKVIFYTMKVQQLKLVKQGLEKHSKHFKEGHVFSPPLDRMYRECLNPWRKALDSLNKHVAKMTSSIDEAIKTTEKIAQSSASHAKAVEEKGESVETEVVQAVNGKCPDGYSFVGRSLLCRKSR